MDIPAESIPILDKSTILNSLVDPTPPEMFRPTGLIAITPLFVLENQAFGTVVGQFDANDTEGRGLIFELVNDPIVQPPFVMEQNGTLRVAGKIDYSMGEQVKIRVKVTAQNGLSIEQDFMVKIRDLILPIIETVGFEKIDNAEVKLKGSVLNIQHASKILERGFYVSDKNIVNFDDESVYVYRSEFQNNDSFSVNIGKFLGRGKYYFIAYVRTDEGLSYGLEEEFIIPGNKIVTWLDATPVSDMQNWWQSLWFGSFYRTGDMDWIMHESLGWLYMSPSLHGGTWFWNEDLEWMWTDSLRFPFMFSNSRNSWLYFYGNHRNQKLFYNYRDEKWIVNGQIIPTGVSNENLNIYEN